MDTMPQRTHGKTEDLGVRRLARSVIFAATKDARRYPQHEPEEDLAAIRRRAEEDPGSHHTETGAPKEYEDRTRKYGTGYEAMAWMERTADTTDVGDFGFWCALIGLCPHAWIDLVKSGAEIPMQRRGNAW